MKPNIRRHSRAGSNRGSAASQIGLVRRLIRHRLAINTALPSRHVELALNEAAALAGQTPYPSLFFPELAAEKAREMVAWHSRQVRLRSDEHSVAFTA
jgi:hypothetical protein